MDDRGWELLKADLARIERKVDKINGLCERVAALGLAIKWLYGIIGALLTTLIVAWLRNGGL